MGWRSGSAPTSRAAAGSAPWLARHGLPPPYLPQGQRYDIGERSLYLDCRGSGSPTVVLEAGSGSDSATWSAVHDAIAATTRTCAYDRAGRGRSDARETHTLADAVADLRALLDAAGEAGPSSSPATRLGGSYARVSPRPTGTRSSGRCSSTLRARHPGRPIHPLLGELQPEYEAELTACGRRCPAWTGSTGRRARAAPGVVVRRHPARGPRGGPLRAAPDEATNEAIADAWRDGMEALSPGSDVHDRVRRRPQHPYRTARHGDRRRASPRRRRSRPTDRGAILRSHGPAADDHRAVPHPRRRAHPASPRATSARRRSRRPASTCSRSTPRTC